MAVFVDLNSDIGEGFGDYSIGMDEEILKHVTSANIACYFHAGDPLIMDNTVKMAKRSWRCHRLSSGLSRLNRIRQKTNDNYSKRSKSICTIPNGRIKRPLLLQMELKFNI